MQWQAGEHLLESSFQDGLRVLLEQLGEGGDEDNTPGSVRFAVGERSMREWRYEAECGSDFQIREWRVQQQLEDLLISRLQWCG